MFFETLTCPVRQNHAVTLHRTCGGTAADEAERREERVSAVRISLHKFVSMRCGGGGEKGFKPVLPFSSEQYIWDMFSPPLSLHTKLGYKRSSYSKRTSYLAPLPFPCFHPLTFSLVFVSCFFSFLPSLPPDLKLPLQCHLPLSSLSFPQPPPGATSASSGS